MVKTLIVDDSDAFRRSLRHLLSSKFPYMQIAEAATMRDAVLCANAIRADLVFADVRLRDGSGLELAGLLATTLPQVRVCIVTSLDLPEYRSAALALGAWQFLPKADSTSEQIAAVVEATLAHRLPTLVIDADAALRGMIRESLQAHWPVVMVFEAANARGGLRMASALRPELVLVRVSMLAGAKATLGRSIKALDASTTLVAFGRDFERAMPERQRAAALRAGADHAVAWRAGIDDTIAAIVDGVLARRPELQSFPPPDGGGRGRRIRNPPS